MVPRNKSTRKDAIASLNQAWNAATERERALWVEQLRANYIRSLRSQCESVLVADTTSPDRHAT